MTHVRVKVAMDLHNGKHFESFEEIDSVTEVWPQMVPLQHKL